MSRRSRSRVPWAALWALAVILAIMAGAAFIGAIFADRELDIIASSPGVAEATVIKVETHRGRRGSRSYEPIVQFVTASGETRSVSLERLRDSSYYEVGETLTIRYATSNPEYSYDTRRPPTPNRSWTIGWVTAPLAVAAGITAGLLTRRDARRKARGLGDS